MAPIIYLRIFIALIIIYTAWYIYRFIKLNKNQLSMIFKRGKFFYSNPYIKQTLISSTFKFIIKLLRKSFFKF